MPCTGNLVADGTVAAHCRSSQSKSSGVPHCPVVIIMLDSESYILGFFTAMGNDG